VRMRLVHGFTQTRRSWEPVERCLPSDWDVQAVEVPDGLDFVTTAETLGLRGGEGTWGGYSLGARLCLRLALDRPNLVDRLGLVSASAGIASAGGRAARVAADERLAQSLDRDGLATFLDRWLDQRLFETLPRHAAMLDDRRRGNTVQRVAHQLRVLGQGAQEPLWDRLGELDMPVLLVTGQWDRAYTETAEQMAAAIGANARHVTVAKSGHAVHLERPEDVAELLVDFVGARSDAGSGA
jgi:2-succinyl-6-hydroxy-2,4-cyclohexadiene-1-carboxylate synthase